MKTNDFLALKSFKLSIRLLDSIFVAMRRGVWIIFDYVCASLNNNLPIDNFEVLDTSWIHTCLVIRQLELVEHRCQMRLCRSEE